MKPIVIGLSPDIENDDVAISIKEIFKPWTYQKGEGIGRLEQWFRQYFHVSYAVTFSNARAALYVILKALGIKEGDEVIVQAFTCVVVPGPILATGARPVYCDCTNGYVIDSKDLERKITNKTKAIIVQHTFGNAAQMEKIHLIAKRHKLFIIEDVAHTIGGEYKGKKLGTLADAAIFSFGRDKAFSSVFGGLAVTDNNVLGKKIRDYQQGREFPKTSWIIQQLLHPIITSLVLPIYNNIFGKMLLVTAQRMGLLSFPVSAKEKKGIFDSKDVYKMPNALCILAYNQIKKISKYNTRRVEISKKYQDSLKARDIKVFVNTDQPLLRFPVLVDNIKRARDFFRKRKMYIGDWYSNVIDPKDTNLNTIFYKRYSCPNAEKLAAHTINLPVIPTMKDEDIDRVLNTFKDYVGN